MQDRCDVSRNPINRSLLVSICYNALVEALKSRYSGRDDQVNWAAKTMSSSLSESATMDQVAWLVLLTTKKTNTGRFALTYNHDLDLALRTQDDVLLRQLARGDGRLFIELYGQWEQDSLTCHPETSKTIDRIVQREHNAILNVLQEAAVSGFGQKKFDFGFGCSDQQGVGMGSFERCYRSSCLSDDCPFVPDLIGKDRPLFVADFLPGQKVPRVFLFGFDTLIRLLAGKRVVNPYTQQPFSVHVHQQLEERYKAEITLYRRHRFLVDRET